MSININIKKPAGFSFSGSTAFTAELDEKMVKSLRLRPALTRLAKALSQQMKHRCPVGVTMISIDVALIYDYVPDKRTRKNEHSSSDKR